MIVDDIKKTTNEVLHNVDIQALSNNILRNLRPSDVDVRYIHTHTTSQLGLQLRGLWLLQAQKFQLGYCYII